MKQIYASWRLKCGENRRLKLTVVGEMGPNSANLLWTGCNTSNCIFISGVSLPIFEAYQEGSDSECLRNVCACNSNVLSSFCR